MNPYDYYITPDEVEQAAENGISEVTLYNRVRQLGWSKDKAMTTPPRKRSFHNSKWVQIAKGNGICISTYKYRINSLGWTEERAATQPLQDRKAQARAAHESSRRYPIELVDLAKQNNIPYNTFRKRIKDSGWSPEQAATVPVMTHSEAGEIGKRKATERYMNRRFKKSI